MTEQWEVIYDHGWHVVDVTDKRLGGQILGIVWDQVCGGAYQRSVGRHETAIGNLREQRPVSQQWIPSNSTEGHQFINDWCSRCARDSVCNGQKTFDDCDDSELCQILDASFRGEAKEWIEHDDGRTECTAFAPLCAAQPQRDDRTIDMFGEST